MSIKIALVAELFSTFQTLKPSSVNFWNVGKLVLSEIRFICKKFIAFITNEFSNSSMHVDVPIKVLYLN